MCVTICWHHSIKWLQGHYQTEHFFSGFIGVPFAQLKSFAKSSLFDSEPIVRKPPGEWAPVLICFLYAPSRYFEHQTCPQLIQNSCLGVKLWPGNICSSQSWSSFLIFWSFNQSTKIIKNNDNQIHLFQSIGRFLK